MKNNFRFLLIACIPFLSAVTANGASISFGAQIANNIAGVSGANLGANLVEVGTWDGGTFTSLGSGANDSLGAVGPGDGFFANSVAKFNSNGIEGSQLAIRWTDGSSFGILYYDINAVGADASVVEQWTMKGGDGGGTDGNQNIIDISDLTNRTDFLVLDDEAVLIGAEFDGTNAFSVPQFQLVPEPSAYALLAGAMALGWVMIRRRA